MTGRPQDARGWIARIMDPGWMILLDSIAGGNPLGFPGYQARLADARAATGEGEAVVCATGSIGGARAITAAFDFRFLGGSMGVAAGERIARAFETAAREGAAMVAVTATGGARMQEGMLALSQMPATVVARGALARARRPFIAFLAHPTTGGVYASFASLADLLWAEPGATIGFAGPRVARAVTGKALPAGSHTAEWARDRGIVDEVVAPDDLQERLAVALSTLGTRPSGEAAPPPPEPPTRSRDSWKQVRLARHPERPSGGALVEAIAEDRVPLRRGAPGRDDPTLVAAVGRIGDRRAVFIAQDRHAGDGRPRPAGYRRARHALETAVRLGLPVVTIVDTPGAFPGAEAESEGLAAEIALTFRALLEAPVPTVAVVAGEGGSGGALALACCDRVLIQENAIFSVIAPEGAAAILDREDVEALASELRLTAADLRGFGLADRVIAERGAGAHAEPAGAAAEVGRAVAWALDGLRADRPLGSLQLVFSRRAARWRDPARRLATS